MQPSFPTTHVSGAVVEARTRKSCAGVPTRIANVDHGPSLPSLHNVRIKISGVGQVADIPGLTGLDNDGLRHGKIESTMNQTCGRATLSRETKPTRWKLWAKILFRKSQDLTLTFSVRLKNPFRLRTAPLGGPKEPPAKIASSIVDQRCSESWIKCTVGHQEADAGQRFAPNVAWLNQSKLDSSAFCPLSQ